MFRTNTLTLSANSLLDEFDNIFNVKINNFWRKTDKNSIKLIVETPGFDKKSLNVESDGSYVRLFGSNNVSGEKYQCDTSYSVPKGYTIEGCNVTVENGITVIELNKKDQSKKIKIN
jgi:HSP20 family molecular chaperone IbpA